MPTDLAQTAAVTAPADYHIHLWRYLALPAEEVRCYLTGQRTLPSSSAAACALVEAGRQRGLSAMSTLEAYRFMQLKVGR